MARKRRNERKPPRRGAEEPSPHLAEHMRRLQLTSVEQYLSWCRERGFPAKAHKNRQALNEERQRFYQQEVRASFARGRRFGDPLQAFELALDCALDLEAVGQPDLRRACQTLCELGPQRPHRAELLELLRAVHQRGRFALHEETIGDLRLFYLDGLVALNERRRQWRRSLADWSPRSHNRRKQFSSLARHLLADYPVPVFMDSAWLRCDRGSHAHRDLFVHIGSGKNPRTGPTRVPLTKREAHHFLLAPDAYSIEGALRWGQVHALGGDARLCAALLPTPVATDFEHDAFWQSVMHFFVEHPMLDRAQVGPLIDYIDHRKYRPTDAVRPDGSIERRPPPHPGFSMARRTPQALLLQMERWHTQLGRGRGAGPQSWPASGIGDLTWETGRAHKRTWTLRELRSHKALQLEGRAMHNCVASYARSCAAGRCSIWSMELATEGGSERRQTVEVSRQRVIVQSRGKWNVPPGQRELEILRRWSTREQLNLATYL